MNPSKFLLLIMIPMNVEHLFHVGLEPHCIVYFIVVQVSDDLRHSAFIRTHLLRSVMSPNIILSLLISIKQREQPISSASLHNLYLSNSKIRSSICCLFNWGVRVEEDFVVLPRGEVDGICFVFFVSFFHSSKIQKVPRFVCLGILFFIFKWSDDAINLASVTFSKSQEDNWAFVHYCVDDEGHPHHYENG